MCFLCRGARRKGVETGSIREVSMSNSVMLVRPIVEFEILNKSL